MDRFRRLALTTASATLVLVAAGGLVRATGSGLGCLDEWPTCRGGWTAPADWEGVIEYSHRALAGLVVLLLIAQAAGVRRWAPGRRGLRWPSYAAVGVVIGQALLGRVVVVEELHGAWVTAHLLLAMALVALTTGIWAACRDRPTGGDRRVYPRAVGALGAIAALLVVGAYVREKGAGLAFRDWPLMAGGLVPDLGTQAATLHFSHRLLALFAAGYVAWLAVTTSRDARPAVRAAGWTLAGLYVAQVFAGAANVWTMLRPPAVLAHVALGGAVWAAAVALAVFARPAASASPGGGAPPLDHRLRERIGAYVRLTKPRIVVLLLVTTVPAMILAAEGLPSLWLVAATLLGGTMTAGSANAINQYLERDIDAKMSRTRSRPLPAQRVGPGRALAFGVVLGAVGFVWLALTVNMLSAWLAGSAIAFYVGVYTVLLKRSTPQNIVIGGAAGAVPVLVGWSAVTGTLSAPAWILFAIVFFWTPPHFWALAMRYREDYASAGVPMLPVVRGTGETTRQILWYTLALVPVTLALVPVGAMGVLYAAAAIALGGGFVYLAVRLRLEPTPATAMRLFGYSISYLALLFAAIAADSLIAGPITAG